MFRCSPLKISFTGLCTSYFVSLYFFDWKLKSAANLLWLFLYSDHILSPCSLRQHLKFIIIMFHAKIVDKFIICPLGQGIVFVLMLNIAI